MRSVAARPVSPFFRGAGLALQVELLSSSGSIQLVAVMPRGLRVVRRFAVDRAVRSISDVRSDASEVPHTDLPPQAVISSSVDLCSS